MRRRDEQMMAALCHLFNGVPLWGLIFNGLVWFDSQEKSRFLVMQARQAMVFHGLFLACMFIWSIVELFTKLLGVLFAPLGSTLGFLNSAIIIALLALYLCTCLFGALRCWSGESFRYPLIGDLAD
jgi:uncharacterized Tic20 family protein